MVDTNFNWQGLSSSHPGGLLRSPPPRPVAARRHAPSTGLRPWACTTQAALCSAGVTSLSAYWRNARTLTGGAIEVAKLERRDLGGRRQGRALSVSTPTWTIAASQTTTAWTGDFAKITDDARAYVVEVRWQFARRCPVATRVHRARVAARSRAGVQRVRGADPS